MGPTATRTPSVTREALGAWLIKSRRVDGAADRLSGGRRTLSRCVADNYRARLMAAGDPAALWLSGSDPMRPRGIWGLGHLLGPVTGDNGSPDGARLSVPIMFNLASYPIVTDAELRAIGMDDLEVQRMPFGSNPSWISRGQLDRLFELLREYDWPVP